MHAFVAAALRQQRSRSLRTDDQRAAATAADTTARAASRRSQTPDQRAAATAADTTARAASRRSQTPEKRAAANARNAAAQAAARARAAPAMPAPANAPPQRAPPADEPAHYNMRGVPKIAQLRTFERCAILAVLLFYLSTGLWMQESVNSAVQPDASPETIAAARDDILREVVSNDTKAACLEAYQRNLNHRMAFSCCAACGVRDITVQRGEPAFVRVEVAQLARLACTEHDMEQYNALPVEYRPAWDVFEAADGVWYWLHGAFVETVPAEGDQAPAQVATLCKYCDQQLRKSTVTLPRYSLAAGCRLGNLEALQLPQLTVFERAVLSLHRTYGMIVKLTGHSIDSRQSALKGHMICFEHNAPMQLAATLPDLDGLLASLQVVFVGPAGHEERMMVAGLLRTHADFGIRGDVIFEYLRALRVLHPGYATVNLDLSEAMLARLREFPDTLHRMCTFGADERNNRFEAKLDAAATSDVAGVRALNGEEVVFVGMDTVRVVPAAHMQAVPAAYDAAALAVMNRDLFPRASGDRDGNSTMVDPAEPGQCYACVCTQAVVMCVLLNLWV